MGIKVQTHSLQVTPPFNLGTSMSNISSTMQQNADKILLKAEQRCKAKGVRLTPKRKRILSVLIRSEKALSAYELIAVCKAEYNESIPAMSVYRILDFLQQENLAHKLNTTSKYIACVHIDCDHEHATMPQFLICNDCQLVKEISITATTTAAFQSQVKKAGFHLASSQLELHGICEACQASS